MRIRLIDVERDTHEETFGTCDHCMSTGMTTDETFVFENQETGETFRVDGYEWDRGDKMEVRVENVADFAAWLKEQEVPEVLDRYDYSWLRQLVGDYDEHLYGEEE